MARKTDEQFGREWAAKKNIQPRQTETSWAWDYLLSPKYKPHRVPFIVYMNMRKSSKGMYVGAWYPSESDAYSELGRSLRKIVKEVKPLDLF